MDFVLQFIMCNYNNNNNLNLLKNRAFRYQNKSNPFGPKYKLQVKVFKDRQYD